MLRYWFQVYFLNILWQNKILYFALAWAVIMFIGWICNLFLYFCSPLYSAEVTEEAMEPFSQSLSMFLLDVLLRTGNDSMEQTDAALDDTFESQTAVHGYTKWETWMNSGILTSVTPPHQRRRCLLQSLKTASILDDWSSGQLKVTKTKRLGPTYFDNKTALAHKPHVTPVTLFNLGQPVIKMTSKWQMHPKLL